MSNPEISDDRWQRRVIEYFAGDLGAFYTHLTNRLVLYPFIFSFFLLECTSFWLIYYGPAFYLKYMSFTTLYSLHKAAVYTFCLLGADILAHRLIPSWGAYQNRTVGRQWLIWSLGLAIGFVLQRTMIRSLIVIHAPEMVAYFRAHPGEIPHSGTLLLVLTIYWTIVMYLTLRVVKSKQEIARQAASITVKPNENGAGVKSATAESKGRPSGRLDFGGNGDNGSIALADITHVTVEDHYCRINYTTGRGLKSMTVRLTLKEMLSKLPGEHFLRIHRSHMVNMGYASHLTKRGRDYKLVLHQYNVKLPVSRSRFKDLESRLKMVGGSG